jgi:hypothetical protein
MQRMVVIAPMDANEREDEHVTNEYGNPSPQRSEFVPMNAMFCYRCAGDCWVALAF